MERGGGDVGADAVAGDQTDDRTVRYLQAAAGHADAVARGDRDVAVSGHNVFIWVRVPKKRRVVAPSC